MESDTKVMILRLFGDARLPAMPEALLHEDALEGAGFGGVADFVTCTDLPEKAHVLQGSLPSDTPLRFLRPPGDEPWQFQFFATERHLLSYVSHLRRRGQGDRLVMYVDAWDTVWLGCRRNLTRVLEALGRPMFFGAEFDLYPAGLPGYPAAVTEYTNRGLEYCREFRSVGSRWEDNPTEEHQPCLAVSFVDPIRATGRIELNQANGMYLNGGVYGGKASELEIALRRLLSKQALLRTESPQMPGRVFQTDGRTHQFMWNQYLLDRPEQVSVDFGGAFVVNLATRSVAPRQFMLDKKTGMIWSEVFQRPVCIAHANGGGFADSTLDLLHAARTFRFDTTVNAGLVVEDMGRFADRGLYVDQEKQDRIVVDSSICFGPLDPMPGWRGIMSQVNMITPHNEAGFEGMWFFAARPKEHREGEPQAFEVGAVQHMPIVTRKGVPRPRRRNGTAWFEGRNRFEIHYFNLPVGPGECLGWRCYGRCDVTFADLPKDQLAKQRLGQVPAGVWQGAGADLIKGQTIRLDKWRPHIHGVGVIAELTGVDFYSTAESGRDER